MNATTSKRQRNPRGEGENLKKELMDAAMRILDSSPSAPLSLRKVASEAGIAAPSIYAHFADVRMLMSAIVRECWSQMGEAMSSKAEHLPMNEASDHLKAVMSGFVEYAMELPSRYQLLFGMQPMEAEPAETMDGYVRPAYRQIHKALETFVNRDGVLPDIDIPSATLLILSIAHGRIGLAHLAPNREGNSAQSVEKFVINQIDRLFTH